MLYVLRVACPWRDMHERYGKWNSDYARFRRWTKQGVWYVLLETPAELEQEKSQFINYASLTSSKKIRVQY